MAAAREKIRAHRKKTAVSKPSVKLVEPLAKTEADPVREKIRVPVKSRSALVPGEGRSMGMDID
jgi:large subunit ribosomal protein L24e